MKKNAAFYIGEILTKTGISQALLAQLIGISQPGISRIFTGKIKDPGSSTFIKLQKLANKKGIK